jgi:hypothetical protein
MNGSNIITLSAGWKWADTIHDLGMRLCDFAHQDLVVPVYRLKRILTGRPGAVPEPAPGGPEAEAFGLSHGDETPVSC